MKKVLYIIALLSVWVANAVAADGINTYRLNVGAYDKLIVSDNVNVIYRCVADSAGYVVYKGTEDFADAFIFTNNKGTLRIQVSTEDVGKPDLPTIYAYSDYLTDVENSSEFTVRIQSECAVPKFTAKMIGNGRIFISGIKATEVNGQFLTGNGKILIEGKCEKANFTMLGTGVIQADELKAETVKCKIMGGGAIGCWAIEKLDSRGIGSTKIYYKGDPKIKKVGGGKLFPLTSEEAEQLDYRVEED